MRQYRKNKYNAKRCVYKGMSFDSKLERDRFIFLEGEQAAGRIHGLKHHQPFRLEVNGHLVGSYESDFVYTVRGPYAAGTLVIEDVKGDLKIATDLFKQKRRHFEAQYGQRIHIVTKATITSLPHA